MKLLYLIRLKTSLSHDYRTSAAFGTVSQNISHLNNREHQLKAHLRSEPRVTCIP